MTPSKLLPAIILFVSCMYFHNQMAFSQWICEIELDGEIERIPVGVSELGLDFPNGINGPVKIGRDKDGDLTNGCGSLFHDVSNSFSMINRGDCSFREKALNASDANALGLIVCNHSDNTGLLQAGAEIEIEHNLPVVLLNHSSCFYILEAIESGKEVTIRLFQDSYSVVWGGMDEPNSTFDGGLHDWTISGPDSFLWFHSMPISSTPVPAGWGSNPASHYDYSLNPNLNVFPRFYGIGTDRRILSETKDNGFAMIDIDSWNNTEFNYSEKFPNATLISPKIDLSDYQGRSLALIFTQSLRYCCNEDAEFAVQVSTDGFQTYTSFNAIGNQEANAIERDKKVELRLYDFLDAADDLSEFQIRFVMNTNVSHYFWMIDDVQVVELPDVHLEITDAFFPLTSFCVPKIFTEYQEMKFEMKVANMGGIAQDTVIAVVEVLNVEEDEVVFSESRAINNLSRGADSVILFESIYSPYRLQRGDYLITYGVFTPNKPDFEPMTNSKSFLFRISDEIYANEDCFQTDNFDLFRPETYDSWFWGNAFFIDDIFFGGRSSTLDFLGAQFALAMEEDREWTNQKVFVHLLQFREAGKNAVENFDTHNTSVPYEHPDLIPLALALVDPQMINEVGNGVLSAIPSHHFFLPDGTQPQGAINMEFGHYHLLLLQIDVDKREFHHVTVAHNPGNIVSAPKREILYTEEDGYVNIEPPTSRPVVRMLGDFYINTTDESARGDRVKMYPVPATSDLYIDFDLPAAEDIEIEIFDVQGKLLERSIHPNVGTQTINKNVAEYRTGNYLIRIVTKNGVQTQKVLIVK